LIENDVVLGNDCVVKSGVQLWDGVVLEDSVFIGPNVSFSNDVFPRAKKKPEYWLKTVVEAGASIGANATVLPGVRIGAGAMVGAGSVVTCDVPPGEVWFGNPARKRASVKDRLAHQLSPLHEIGSSELQAAESLGGNRRKASVDDCKLLEFQEIVDARGHLTVVHPEVDVGFVARRAYYLYGVPPGGARGGHAHRVLEECLIAISGSFEVVVNDGVRQKRFVLNHPKQGLRLPTMIWRELAEFSAGAVCLVLASAPYDEFEYIRSFSDFVRMKLDPSS
jgi:hypothetical protein